MTRLKQAKEEAEKEIAEYRSQMELAFQKKVAAVSFCVDLFLILSTLSGLRRNGPLSSLSS